jgi:hypothetical protein
MEPLVDKQFLLKKIPGKGGWTYAEIPEIEKDKSAPFGWVKVTGYIDGFKISNYPLQPMGNGNLFLPVKAEIRKQINKQAGDTVRVILYQDNTYKEIFAELKSCLEDADLHHKFESLREKDRKASIDWICSSKNDQDKIKRMITIIDQLSIK